MENDLRSRGEFYSSPVEDSLLDSAAAAASLAPAAAAAAAATSTWRVSRSRMRAGLPSLTDRLLTHYSFQKIRTIAFRLLQSSLATPARNLGVIAGQQNFGRPHAFELRRPCVVRIIQDAIRERFGGRRCLAAQRTG